MDFSLLDAYLDRMPAEEKVPAYEIIVTKGKDEVYRRIWGFSDAEKTRPASTEDYYWFYSCTKVMTQVAVMQLIEQKKIHLYDPVCLYLPEFECMKVYDHDLTHMMRNWDQIPAANEPVHYAKRQIRIIDLMAMMGGLSYHQSRPAQVKAIEAGGGHVTTREMIRALAEEPLFYEPGEGFAYSLCHDVLGALIEVVSGERYSTYLKNHVFGPVGADALGFLPDEETLAHFSKQYAVDPESGDLVPVNENRLNISDQYESAGGGMYGQLSSYSRVLQALACGGMAPNGNRILEESSVRMFTVGVTTGDAQKRFEMMEKGPYAYGLGVRVKNNAAIGRSPVGEFGWDGAAGAYALVDPMNEISISYIHHILGHPTVYTRIHPTIRDLTYQALGL